MTIGLLGMRTEAAFGMWSCSDLVTADQLEHDRPLLEQALREGRETVTVGRLWWRRKWTFTSIHPFVDEVDKELYRRTRLGSIR